jgi:putative radical SAM enzyme (TIGR03279 family)
MPTSRIVAVAPGSPADRAGIAPGDELVGLNGEQLRDIIRYQLQADDAEVDVEVRRRGEPTTVHISKAPGASLGLELESAVFDRVRTCDNHCPFCFIHQLPSGMRRSLYLKDDDYRLSFLYGNFTTLTRFTEADFERVVSEALSPLYVSIHATDPDVRTRLLRNRRGATSLRWLELLLDAGIDVHGQIVVCPGINDGDVLDDTLRGILDRFAGLASIGVVPLGVSAHNTEAEMRPHTRAEAVAVVECVEAWQQRFTAVLGHHLVDVSDEYYLLAGLPFPDRAHYGACPQHENGVGMITTFHTEIDAALAGVDVTPASTRPGFFAWVDGAPADGYRAPRLTGDAPTPVSRPDAGAVHLVTGEYGRHALEPVLGRLSAAAGRPVRALTVANRFFGGNIAVTGLLTGADVAAAIEAVPSGDRILLPDVVLSRGRFLDGVSVAELPRVVEIVATDGVALVEAVLR